MAKKKKQVEKQNTPSENARLSRFVGDGSEFEFNPKKAKEGETRLRKAMEEAAKKEQDQESDN